ncbi:AbrB family transcriptional regulator [Neobacillus mesonae]|uniref:AbrB family transcriptional regulator n=1 Tax=Neobacillus mesonae TaxID=1193713 RepID=UPI000AB2D5E7|nr:AbrB family transcriptional regulator [Neobacillus mesonae]
MKNLNLIGFFVTLMYAFIGGLLFSALHTPIPWLLGPMTAVFIGSRFGSISYNWPSWIRNAGLIIVGYSVGLSFTREALFVVIGKLPSMMLMTVLLVCFCAGIAWVVSKLSGVDYPTVLTGSIPGGLSQMIIFAEEMKGIDLTTVTFLQVARLMMIIFFVPFLILGPFFNHSAAPVSGDPAVYSVGNPLQGNLSILCLLGVICVLCAFIAKRLKFPTPFMLGPILATAICSISGLEGPSLTPPLLDLSQFMIGGYIGLLLQPEKLHHKVRVISLALISGMVMILGSWCLSLILVYYNQLTPSTSFLGVAPGEMDQMAILAHEVNADLSVVTGYQLFRLFFIYFAVPPLLRLFFLKRPRNKGDQQVKTC